MHTYPRVQHWIADLDDTLSLLIGMVCSVYDEVQSICITVEDPSDGEGWGYDTGFVPMNSMNSDEVVDLFGDDGGGLLVGNVYEDDDGFVERVAGLVEENDDGLVGRDDVELVVDEDVPGLVVGDGDGSLILGAGDGLGLVAEDNDGLVGDSDDDGLGTESNDGLVGDGSDLRLVAGGDDDGLCGFLGGS